MWYNSLKFNVCRRVWCEWSEYDVRVVIENGCKYDKKWDDGSTIWILIFESIELDLISKIDVER